jgi:hypothetical protein
MSDQPRRTPLPRMRCGMRPRAGRRAVYGAATGITRRSPCTPTTTLRRPFEWTSKRRRGFPLARPRSSAGPRIVHDDTELIERLGARDPCPCGSGRRFPPLLPAGRRVRRHERPLLRSGSVESVLATGGYSAARPPPVTVRRLPRRGAESSAICRAPGAGRNRQLAGTAPTPPVVERCEVEDQLADLRRWAGGSRDVSAVHNPASMSS